MYKIKIPIATINPMARLKYIYDDLIKLTCHEYSTVKANSDKKPMTIPAVNSLVNRFFVLLSTTISLLIRTLIIDLIIS